MSEQILIVDDLQDNLQIISNILHPKGYRISVASSGSKALKRVAIQAPDLILLDIFMPEMDGFEVCKSLKENPETANIPVIFLTALSETENILKGFEYGAVDYITKPFNSLELISRIKTHLEIKRSRDTIAEQSAKLQKQNEELIQLNKTKNKFFSIIAHDLKSPFNNIIGFSSLLLRNKNNYSESKRNQFTKLIANSAQNAFTLLENLLEWSRAQTGHIEFFPSTFNIAAISDEIVALYANEAQRKQITLQSEINKEQTIFGDPNMIRSILRNLVSNALKFTNSSGIVSIQYFENEEYAGFLVQDSGIGMNSQEIEKILLPNQIYSTKGTDSEKGTGLGLMLCHEFVAQHHGTLELKSKESKGSTFSVLLPKEKKK